MWSPNGNSLQVSGCIAGPLQYTVTILELGEARSVWAVCVCMYILARVCAHVLIYQHQCWWRSHSECYIYSHRAMKLLDLIFSNLCSPSLQICQWTVSQGMGDPNICQLLLLSSALLLCHSPLPAKGEPPYNASGGQCNNSVNLYSILYIGDLCQSVVGSVIRTVKVYFI